MATTISVIGGDICTPLNHAKDKTAAFFCLDILNLPDQSPLKLNVRLLDDSSVTTESPTPLALEHTATATPLAVYTPTPTPTDVPKPPCIEAATPTPVPRGISEMFPRIVGYRTIVEHKPCKFNRTIMLLAEIVVETFLKNVVFCLLCVVAW
jgi:hypothetical protein